VKNQRIFDNFLYATSLGNLSSETYKSAYINLVAVPWEVQESKSAFPTIFNDNFDYTAIFMDDVIDSDHLPKVSLISSSKWIKVCMMVIIPAKYSNVFASIFSTQKWYPTDCITGTVNIVFFLISYAKRFFKFSFFIFCPFLGHVKHWPRV